MFQPIVKEDGPKEDYRKLRWSDPLASSDQPDMDYNEEKPRPGPSNLFNITTKRLMMRGIIVSDSLDRRGEFGKEVGGYFAIGQTEKL